jgi:hypothetical protein
VTWTNCAECNREAPPGRYLVRSLCDSCRWWITHHGDIEEYPRVQRKSWEVLEDYLFIKAQDGGTLQHIADRMGMKRDTLEAALRRQGVKHSSV